MAPVQLPPFAPRRLPPINRSIRPTDVPASVQPFLQAVYTVIHNRPRHFKQTPTTVIHPSGWWSLKEHRRPTRWSLYRNLLKYSAQFEERLKQSNIQKIRSRPRNRDAFSLSPVLFRHIKKKFRRMMGNRSIADVQEALRQGYLLLNNFLEAEVGGSEDHRNQIKSYRRGLVETRHRRIWAQVYKSQLANRKPPTPIMTGRFLRPTILNGPLPRLAHQPLHISMMISSRRKKREKRLAELRHLNEKLELIKMENQFEKAFVSFDEDTSTKQVLDQEHSLEVQGIMDRLKVINHSFDLERARQKRVYSRDLLDKIEAAKRRRPIAMRGKNQWKRMKTRLEELRLAYNDDPSSPDASSPESKSFSLPDPSFWVKK